MYAGLTISDKPALMDAKQTGMKWIARDWNDGLYAYADKPQRNGDRRWFTDGAFYAGLSDDSLKFIHWSDAEPVNIDLALAQIAEMESAEKPTCPYCSTDAFSPYRIGVYNANGFKPFHVFGQYGGKVSKEEQFDFCPKCARRINSPYTEGEAK